MAISLDRVVKFLGTNRQLVFGIVLMIVVPSLVVFNTLFFLGQFKKALDIEIHRRALLIGEVAGPFVRNSLGDDSSLQQSLDSLVGKNRELIGLSIAKVIEGDFVVSASTDINEIGTRDTSRETQLTWFNKQSFAHEEQDIVNEAAGHWVITKPILNDSEQVIAIIKMKLSTEILDQWSANIMWRSFVILLVSVVIIILLLATNTRIFQYALLFRKLQEVDKAKDEFISMASHELRTPISSLRGYFSMLLEGSLGTLNKKAKDVIGLMYQNTTRLNSLVEDILNVSRIQQGRIKIASKEALPDKIINEVVSELKPKIIEKGLLIQVEEDESKSKIFIDANVFKQVLVNLIGNAIKYTNKGGITIKIIAEYKNVLIKIKDTGVGIPAVEQEKLFEKFHRVKNEDTRDISGTGLGLWITKALVEMMSGKIYIDSIEKVGSQATLVFPLKKT